MSCFHPLKAYPVGFHPSGKPKYKICPYQTNHVEILQDGSSVFVTEPTIGQAAVRLIYEYEEIPCGKCIGCRLNYSRQWADRCMLELGYHEQSWFITLTYDDDHLPHNVDSNSGEIFSEATLNKRDFQLFMKSLRKDYAKKKGYDNKIRYFCAGEYGSQTYRPHYHVIMFGLKLDDLKLYKQTMNGYNLYTSEFLTDTWKNGHVVVAQVSWDTCAYTARYIMKKLNGSAAEFYDKYHIEPEFTLMSRKPGIGRQYYEDHSKDLFKNKFFYLGTKDGSHTIKPPKYYEKLYDVEYPSDSELRKSRSKEFAREMKELKLQSTSLPYLEMLKVEKENLIEKTKCLKRKEI